MAFDEVQAKQRLLDDALLKQRQLNDRLAQYRLALQAKKNQLMSHYKGEGDKIQRDIATLQNNINLIQKDVVTLQKKQSDLQAKLRELQDEQTSRQTKLSEQQKRYSDMSAKLSGIMRDQDQSTKRLDTDYDRMIKDAERELAQVTRGIGTLQADLTRATEKQRTAHDAIIQKTQNQYQGRSNLNITTPANLTSRPTGYKRAA